MRSVIAWAIRQSPAMNTIMVALLAVGLFAGTQLRREEFPQFELEIVLITVPYPGASPEEVESGICQKIEEAVRRFAIRRLRSASSTQDQMTLRRNCNCVKSPSVCERTCCRYRRFP